MKFGKHKDFVKVFDNRFELAKNKIDLKIIEHAKNLLILIYTMNHFGFQGK